jgi:hypothetical protein
VSQASLQSWGRLGNLILPVGGSIKLSFRRQHHHQQTNMLRGNHPVQIRFHHVDCCLRNIFGTETLPEKQLLANILAQNQTTSCSSFGSEVLKELQANLDS